MLICLCSKNNSDDALNVFKYRNDMLIKLEHIVCSKINWNAKSQNIHELSKELNLGTDSFIFIDDNPMETAEVQAKFPEILCLTLPNEHNEIPCFLNHVWAFDHLNITDEDKIRTKLYQENNQREQFRKLVPTFESFITNLNIKIHIETINKESIERVSQLTLRTNQFNFSTIRYTEPQLTEALNKISCIIVRVSDRFGDYGLVGTVFYQIIEDTLIVYNLLLSCRVLGKGIEHKLINKIGAIALEKNCSDIRLQYIASEKNKPAQLFLNSLEGTKVQRKKNMTEYIISPYYAKQFVFNFNKEQCKSESQITSEKKIRNYQPFLMTIAKNFRTPSIILNEIHPIKKSRHINHSSQNHNLLESGLIHIWENNLKIAPILSSDHFLDLGGNSLLAVLIIAQIWRETGIQLSIIEFLQAPTIAELTILLSKKKGTPYSEITPISNHLRYTPLPLSHAQERLWFIQQLDSSSSLYNMFCSLQLKGPLSITALEKAFHKIIYRHESLRTYFIEENGTPKQIVIPRDKFQFSLVQRKLSKISNHQLFQLAKEEAKKPFDLTQAPLIRTTLISTNKNTYHLFICLHHIIHDGWSFDLFCKEINLFYTDYSQNINTNIEEPSVQYIDFTMWQTKFLSQTNPQEISYWKDKLKDPPILHLPTKPTENAKNDHIGKRVSFTIDENITTQLKNIAKQSGTTLYTILLTAFSVLLAHYSGQEDLIIGSPFSGRHYPGVEKTLGFFVNLITLRIQFIGNPSFQELLNQTKKTVEEAYTNQDIPFEQLIQILKPDRKETLRNPLIQVFFAFQNYQAQNLSLPGINIEHTFGTDASILLADFDSAKFDFSLYLQETSNLLKGLVEYSAGLFTQNIIDFIIENFQSLLKEIILHPEQPIFNLRFLDKTKSDTLLNKWNNTKKTFLFNQSIQTIFEKQAKKTPYNIAISYRDQTLTYTDLNKKANLLAHFLIKKGASTGDCIVVYIEGNINLPISILATLKAGCTYVPIPHNTPIERLKTIYHDCQPSIVLTQKSLTRGLEGILTTNQILIELDNIHNEIEKGKSANIRTKKNPSAYIIYTSGSTGYPKGVILKHQTIINLINWQTSYKKSQGINKIAQYATFGFDVSLQEIFFSLLNGCQLCIVPIEIRSNMEKLSNFIKNNEIQVLFLPTSVLDLFISESITRNTTYPYLQKIIVAGEKLVINEAIKSFYIANPHISLSNHYGPSETHVVTNYDLGSDPNYWDIGPPIGKPIDNTEIYILNKYLSPVPIGAVGEICVAGMSVAKGYLNKPDYTAKKFIVNPFYRSSYSILYKTGDLGRWTPDGNIEYNERIDNQIKIRGFRVELNEIEERLRFHHQISQVVVLYEKNTTLVAHIIPNESEKIDKESLMEYLDQYLPHYMLPHIYKIHKYFPLTQNGKIDTELLLKSENPLILQKVNHQIATTKTQEIVLDIFSQLLKMHKTKISIDDNFFSLGGHSLLTVHLISLIKKTIKTDIYLQDIFDHPTVKKISALIDNNIGKKKSLEKAAIFKNPSLKSPLLLNKDNKFKFFLIHPLSGTIFNYMHLAKELDDKVSCYGIQYPLIDSDPIELHSIPQIAAYYIKRMQEIQPKGPYCIGGHSLGGLISIEMAHQLMHANEKINGLYLLDTWVLATKHENIDAYYKKYLSTPWEETIAKQIKDQLNIDLHKVSHHLFSLGSTYIPPLLQTEITLFKAQKSEIINDETNYIAPFSI